MRIATLKSAEILQTSPYVHTIHFKNISASWEQWLLLTSDRHVDNIHSDQKLQLKHLEKAVERNALIIDVGDMFDVMQSKDDRRADKSALREENKQTAYLDSVVSSGHKLFREFAPWWALSGKGNHETAILGKYGTDLTDRFAVAMRAEKQGITHTGGYAGFVRFMFEINKTARQSAKLFYHHGGTSGAIMSFGTLSTRRIGSWVPDADIVAQGHTHDGYALALPRLRINDAGTLLRDVVHYIRTPGYKDEATSLDSWAMQKEMPTKGLGCAWVRFHYEGGRVVTDAHLEVT